MELKKSNGKLRCELGNCANRADYAVTFSGLNRAQDLCICRTCLRELELATRKLRRIEADVSVGEETK